ncbi:anti-sigma factor domain-containing protein [Demequina aurantiaca]|uniref:anti-sigma factor domain-containing protein n=1 Tax=Demequina aurantiaca TaxID=676200 RepID=UPI003D332162
MNDFESMHDLVGAYALDAIDDSERTAFDAHLDDCAQCREELASFGFVLDALSDDAGDESADSVQAPAGLADRIGAQIALTPQVSVHPASLADDAAAAPTGANTSDDTYGDTSASIGGAASDGNTADMPRVEADILSAGAPATDGSPQSENVVPFARPTKTGGESSTGAAPARRSRMTMMLASAAAAVAVAAVGIGFLVSNGSPDANLAAVESVLQAPDAFTLDLGVGDAQLTLSEDVGGFAVTGNAPDLAAGEQYQLWVVNGDGTIDPGPTFDSGDFQTAVVGDLDNLTSIAVSVEPAGGSLQPTTDPITVVDV